MLRKLLKHEFVATGRVMWVIYVAMLGLSVVTNAAFRLLDHPAVTFTLIRALLKLTIAAWVISLIVGGVATVVLMVKRRRWIDRTTGRSVGNEYDTVAHGTRMSKELALFFQGLPG